MCDEVLMLVYELSGSETCSKATLARKVSEQTWSRHTPKTPQRLSQAGWYCGSSACSPWGRMPLSELCGHPDGPPSCQHPWSLRLLRESTGLAPRPRWTGLTLHRHAAWAEPATLRGREKGQLPAFGGSHPHPDFCSHSVFKNLKKRKKKEMLP